MKIQVVCSKNENLPRVLFYSDISLTSLGLSLVEMAIKYDRSEKDFEQIQFDLELYFVNETTVFSLNKRSQMCVVWMLLSYGLMSGYGCLAARPSKLTHEIFLPWRFLDLRALSEEDLLSTVCGDPWLYLQLNFCLGGVKTLINTNSLANKVTIGDEVNPAFTRKLIALVESPKFTANPPEELISSLLSYEEFNKSMVRGQLLLSAVVSSFVQVRSRESVWGSLDSIIQLVSVQAPASYVLNGYLDPCKEVALFQGRRFFVVEGENPQEILFVCPFWNLLEAKGRARLYVLLFLPLLPFSSIFDRLNLVNTVDSLCRNEPKVT
jgi:hypothetical protein